MLTFGAKQVDVKAKMEISQFNWLREVISEMVGPDFRDHYCDAHQVFSSIDALNAYDDKTQVLKKKYKDATDIIEFLYMYDTDGEIGYKTCSRILTFLEDSGTVNGAPWASNFIKLLTECTEHKHRLFWMEGK